VEELLHIRVAMKQTEDWGLNITFKDMLPPDFHNFQCIITSWVPTIENISIKGIFHIQTKTFHHDLKSSWPSHNAKCILFIFSHH
jgi:hypothetical protein